MSDLLTSSFRFADSQDLADLKTFATRAKAIDDGAIRLRDVRADPGLLDEFAAPPERRAWWLDRLRRVHAVLASPTAR